MTFPVHKTLLVAGKLDDQAHVEHERDGKPRSIKQVVDGPWTNLQRAGRVRDATAPVNLGLGQDAINIFRKDIAESLRFEKEWFDSGLADVVTWIVEGSKPSPQALKEPVADLIEAVSVSVSNRISQGETDRKARIAEESMSVLAKRDLDRSLSTWAEHAHTELRDRLDQAFHQRSWGKTRWWRLLWRVDEVEYRAKELLEQSWLVDAEKELIWFSGRVDKAGAMRSRGASPEILSGRDHSKGITKPWAQDIELAKKALALSTVPALQSAAQSLLFQSVSTTVLTSSLSMLVYLANVTPVVFEAGAVGALGVMLSARLLQKRWEGLREAWQEAVREAGRETLRRCEDRLRAAISEADSLPEMDAESEDLNKARRAVEAVRRELKALQQRK